jgi:hypothetical protein
MAVACEISIGSGGRGLAGTVLKISEAGRASAFRRFKVLGHFGRPSRSPANRNFEPILPKGQRYRDFKLFSVIRCWLLHSQAAFGIALPVAW